MAELVDALVSNTNNFTVVPVRPRLRVPSRNFSKFFGNSGFFDSLNPLIDQRCRRSSNLFSGFDNRYFLNRRPSRWERAYFGTATFGSFSQLPFFTEVYRKLACEFYQFSGFDKFSKRLPISLKIASFCVVNSVENSLYTSIDTSPKAFSGSH